MKKISDAASASEGMRRKHRLQSLRHRGSSPATALEPLSVLGGLPSPPEASRLSTGSLFSRSSSLGLLEGSIGSGFNTRYNASHNIGSNEKSQEPISPEAAKNIELVAILTAKCNALAERLGNLESELANARGIDDVGNCEGATGQSASSSIKKASAERIDGTMVAMREKIGQLKDVFIHQ